MTVDGIMDLELVIDCFDRMRSDYLMLQLLYLIVHSYMVCINLWRVLIAFRHAVNAH